MRSTLVVALTLVVLACLCGTAFATEYFVAPYGNDSNPGTIDQPFLTIYAATSISVAGDIVSVRAGTYNEEVRTYVDGTPGAYITIQSYDGDLAAYVTEGFNIKGRCYVRIIGFEASSGSAMPIHIQPGDSRTLLPRAQYVDVLRCWFHEPSRYDCIKINQADYVLFEDCEISGPNGDEQVDTVWLNYGTFRRCFVHDYYGIGVTFKGGSHYAVMEDCVITHALNDIDKATRFGGSTDARYRDPSTQYASEYTVFRNNIIQDCRAAATGDYECWYGYFYNNTVVDCGDARGIIKHHADPKYSGDGGSRHFYSFNNVILDTAGDMGEVYVDQAGTLPYTDWIHDNNNYYNNGNPIPSGTWVGHDPNEDPNSTFGNPNLQNQNGTATTYAGWLDCYRITSASAALIDQGTSGAGTDPLPAVHYDIEGVARPQGAGWDIGAFEYAGGGGPVPPVANFSGNPTQGYAPLTVYFTDQSTGSPTSWSWTFGDSGSSPAQHPSHEYTAVNIYDVSLTVTNPQGQDTETKVDYITVSDQPVQGCHVGAIDMANGGTPGYKAAATITVHDQDCVPLAGVTVNITWTGAAPGTNSGVTNGSGQVTFTSARNKSGGTFTCCVDNLTLAGYPYQSVHNHETCDSITLP